MVSFSIIERILGLATQLEMLLHRSNITEEAHATTKRRSCQLCGGYGHNCLTCKQYNGEGSDYQDEENMTAFDEIGRAHV